MDELNRRAALQKTLTFGAAFLAAPLRAQTNSRPKTVIVIGAGIAGLSCAYELVRRGHDATVLEASGRPGDHVRTSHGPFADALYADIGADPGFVSQGLL